MKKIVKKGAFSKSGNFVNTKTPMSTPGGFYGSAPKAIGPRFGKTTNPKRARFGKKGAGRILRRR